MSLTQLQSAPVMIEQVEGRLLAAIVDGTLPPGHRLTQDGLAAMFGISRQPVSHALQVLKRRGLVVEHGRRGLAVPHLDAGRIRDLYQVRAALDGLAARLAAQAVAHTRASQSAVAALRAALADGQQRHASAALGDLVALDVAFHVAVHNLSGNAAIAETVAEQWPHFMRSMRLVFDDLRMRRRVWREHARIAAAIFAGDAETAAALAHAHALSAGEETAARLEAGSPARPQPRARSQR